MTKIKPRLIARISCQECRRRKTRCNFDGQSQKCSTCARIGTPCIFSQKNGVILDIDKVMEENNPHLLHQREKEQRAKERAKLSATPSSSSSTLHSTLAPAPAPNTSVYSKSTPSSSYLSGARFSHNKSNRSNSDFSASVGHSGRSSSNEEAEELSSVLDRLQIDAFGIAPHTLRSFSQVAGDNDSAQVSAESSETESEHPHKSEAHDEAKPTLSKRNSTGSSHRSSRSRSIPLVDIQPDLIDLYFKHIHPYLLVLHKPSFFRRLHDPRDPVPDFLLAAMYAVASHYAPGREQDGRRYFEFWLSRLDDALDKPRLSTIQSLLMVIKYQEGVKNTGFYFRTYMYTQMVIVLARELQLHKTTPVNAKLDPESHEVRRRLFWAIFVLDQFLSVSQGRTMSFREVEPEADLPRTDNEDPNDLEEIEVIENAVEYIKLVKIDHQALILVRKFLTKVVTPEETIPQGLFLHQAMLAWKANLPARLQMAPNMTARNPFVAMLHVLYHACAIMIQRCYCEDPSVSHLEVSTVSRDTCIVAATNITIIIDDVYTNYGIVPMTYPLRGCYFVIYCLIAAATIQVNDIRNGGNGTVMFKRSLALLNHLLRKSSAVDISKEVEILKNSMDTSTDGFSTPVSSSSSAPHYDHRPPLKPILPMSQKYSSKLNFSSSSVTPIRPRKISPKANSSSSINSNYSATGNSAQTSRSSGSNQTSSSSQQNSNQSATPAYSSPSSSSLCGSKGSSDQVFDSSSQSPNSSVAVDDDLDIAIKSSPSPDLSSRSISVCLSDLNNDDAITSTPRVGTEPYLQSVPTFTAPASLPSDFNAFALAQQAARGGDHNPPPLMSLTQFLAFQQEQQRLNLKQQQAAASTSLDQMTASQIQVQHLDNQQGQTMQFQQQQQQQQLLQQDPALFNSFLNSFSNLGNYQQLNSDQAQNELLSMLDSSMFNYNNNSDSFGLASSTGSTFMPQQQQQQHHRHQDSISSISPTSTTISSAFSPDTQNSFGSFFLPSNEQNQQQQQGTAISDETLLANSALERNHLQDTPSPEAFQVLDMTSSFPSYIGSDNSVPFGVRQNISDVEKIFKFQAEAELTTE
ncbi:hypothetical protein BGX21_002539 [Mortierella sp. AD011]|nr:hypothetical protein BGX20_009086 [Mortierella sp. AD010]KAF9401155.1 hypothetical protein BGX21_002539 [Mortierella sp. AD011]